VTLPLNVVVCIKRVPDTGERIELTADGMRIDTSKLEFAISPHEECAVEEAIRIIEKHGGKSIVVSLGPAGTTEQIREALAKGINHGILLETEDEDWDPAATASALAEAIKNLQFDIVLFGNESADTSNYQVGLRVAAALDIPCVTGIKGLEIKDGKAIAKREVRGGWEVFAVNLPAAFTVKEGINNPRHPSLRGIMAAKRIEIERRQPAKKPPQLIHRGLRKPPEGRGQIEILGEGVAAVPILLEKIKELGVI